MFYGSRTSPPRLMAHYEYEEGAFTPCQDIVSDADRYKENVNASASGIYSLGSIIQDVWGTKVQKVRRGPRNNQKNVYLNLKRRQIANISMETERAVRSSLLDEVSNLEVPKDWKMVENSPNCISIVRLENWEINNVRASTEVVVTRSAASTDALIEVKAHGCKRDLASILGFHSMPMEERIGLAIDCVEKSSFCTGISLPNEDSLQVFVPHITTTYKTLEQQTENEVNKFFSLKCLVFSPPGSKCSECRQLLKLHNTKMQRREKRVGIHPKCNKRYLRKEEVVLQVHQEQKRRVNAEKRERYWREKFENESVEVQNDDNSDLTCIFQGVAKEKVPEEMACLWEQQKRIMHTKSKRGYRWHPK